MLVDHLPGAPIIIGLFIEWLILIANLKTESESIYANSDHELISLHSNGQRETRWRLRFQINFPHHFRPFFFGEFRRLNGALVPLTIGRGLGLEVALACVAP